ncbi:ABC transporter ATP-binding protein [Agromyces bauzanensis]
MTGIGPPDRNRPALECRRLTKDYGGGNGLFDFEVRVAPGEIFGLIGPNGAGKSTMIKLIMDLIRADAGSATVLGLDSRRDSVAVKRRVGYVPGELPQFPGVSARYVIDLLAGLRGGVDRAYVAELAGSLKLDLDRKFQDLSHGNKQKVAIIQAFMHRPDLYVLDEPTLGLDPLVQREFRRLLLEANERGATVLLSSHVLSEVELICTRIGLLKQGRLWKVGTLDELRELRTHRVELVLRDVVDAGELGGIPNVRNVEVHGNRASLEVQGSIDPLIDALAPRDVIELDSRELSLEEVFFAEF